MPHHNTRRRPGAAAAAVLLLLLASLALAACGGSSSSAPSTAAASTSASTTTGTTGTAGQPTKAGTPPAFVARVAKLRACLKAQGIALPTFKAGAPKTPGTGGGPAGGASKLPAGVSRAQYEAALKKCGGGFPYRGFGGGTGLRGRVSSPAFKAALAKFAQCMRENGVNVPSPNTSGKGPIFNTQGLNPTSAKFRTAEQKCSPQLRAGFGNQPGTGTGAPAQPGAAG